MTRLWLEVAEERWMISSGFVKRKKKINLITLSLHKHPKNRQKRLKISSSNHVCIRDYHLQSKKNRTVLSDPSSWKRQWSLGWASPLKVGQFLSWITLINNTEMNLRLALSHLMRHLGGISSLIHSFNRNSFPYCVSGSSRKILRITVGTLVQRAPHVALVLSHRHSGQIHKSAHMLYRAHHQSSASQYSGKSIRQEFQSPSVSHTSNRIEPWWSRPD